MTTPFLDPSGNSISEVELLGYGRSGVVILTGNVAVKVPLRYTYTSPDDLSDNIMVIQREQKVYEQLAQCDGVIPYISSSEKTTQLAFMKNGDLRSYLSRNKPSKSLQLSWFRQMAHGLSHVHDHLVIVADIACRNFLLDSDLSIKVCDFTESTIMPPDTNMETDDDNGYSIQTDIGQLGKVIYEVATGRDCVFDLHQNDASRATLPQREDLPTTHGVWLGSIIEKCWTPGAYRNAKELLEDLETVSLGESRGKHHVVLAVGAVGVAAWLGYRLWTRR